MLKQIIKASMLLIAFVANAANYTYGQSFQAVYTYDNNGNRKTANIIYLNVSTPSNAPSVEEKLKLDEASELKIDIFPNPTQGDLRVKITGGSSKLFDNTSNSIKVWDMNGRLIVFIKPLGESNRVDLTQFNKGAYIMHLTFGGVTKNYKILKN